MSIHIILFYSAVITSAQSRTLVGRCLHGYEAHCYMTCVPTLIMRWPANDVLLLHRQSAARRTRNLELVRGRIGVPTKFGSSTMLSSFYISNVRKLIVSSENCSFRTLISFARSISKQYRCKFIFRLQIVRE